MDTIICDNQPSLFGEPGNVDAKGGDDAIELNGATLTSIRSGSGDDTIDLNNGSIRSRVFGGIGDDTITLDGATVDFDLQGDGGDDTFNLYSGSANDVNGGDGNDVFTLDGANVKRIGGGSGDNLIYLYSGTVEDVVVPDDGNAENRIVLDGATVNNSIRTESGRDILELRAGTVHGQILLGGGDDEISVGTADGTTSPSVGNILAASGDDKVFIYSGRIVEFGSNSLGNVQGDAGADQITLYGGSANAIRGDGTNIFNQQPGGDDKIRLFGGAAAHIFGDGGADHIELNGADVGYVWGDSAPNQELEGDDGNDTIQLLSGTLRHGLWAGKKSDSVTVGPDFDLNPLTGVFDGGDDASVADGEIDQLFLQSNLTFAAEKLTNWEKITVTNADLTLTGEVFVTSDADGYGISLQNAKLDLDDGIHFTGDLMIDGASTLFGGTENGGGVYDLIGDLTTNGQVDLHGRKGRASAGDSLMVIGNFHGGGSLFLDVVLDDGTSQQTDKLTIVGDTSGTTRVFVNNDGGIGGETGSGTQDGIRIVEVAGASNGVFELGGPVEAGAFRYGLHKADGQNWILQSEGLSCGVVLASQMPPNLRYFGAQLIGSWYERGGSRFPRIGHGSRSSLTGRGGTDQLTSDENVPANKWARWIRGSTSADGNVAGAGSRETVSYQDEYWAMQTGIDGPIATNSLGEFSIGAFLHYGKIEIDGTNETTGNRVGSYDTIAYGGGITGTFVADKNFYFDAVISYTKYELDMVTAPNGTGSTFANGGSISGEAGWRVPLGDNKALTPQVQFLYQRIAIDGLTDDDGGHSSFDHSDSLTGRVSVSLESSPRQGLHFYGEVGLVHEFLDDPTVAIGGDSFSLSHEKTALLIDLGVHWDASSDQRFWIEGGYRTSLDGGSRESLTFTAGIKWFF